MILEHEKPTHTERSATEPSPTVRVLQQAALERQRQIREEDEQRAQSLRERDPAMLARIFIARKLIFQPFIGHDDVFVPKPGYDPKTTDADEAWLRNQPFLQDSEYLIPLLAHTSDQANKTEVAGRKIFPVEELAPYRPNVLTPLITTATEVLLDHDEWIDKRVKESGELSISIPTSMHRYGHLIEERIGTTPYRLICRFYLDSIREIAQRKQVGGLIQEVHGKFPATISPTILAQLPPYGETYEDAVATYSQSIREKSMIPRANYEFMYKVGELILAVIGKDINSFNTIDLNELEKLTQQCLNCIKSSQSVSTEADPTHS